MWDHDSYKAYPQTEYYKSQDTWYKLAVSWGKKALMRTTLPWLGGETNQLVPRHEPRSEVTLNFLCSCAPPHLCFPGEAS